MVAELVSQYLEDDRDLCSFGLTCRDYRQLAHAEMERRRPHNSLVCTCSHGYPPFIEAVKKETCLLAETVDLLALCMRPCYGNRRKMKEMRNADVIAMNTFALGMRKSGLFDEHVLHSIATNLFPLLDV